MKYVIVLRWHQEQAFMSVLLESKEVEVLWKADSCNSYTAEPQLRCTEVDDRRQSEDHSFPESGPVAGMKYNLKTRNGLKLERHFQLYLHHK